MNSISSSNLSDFSAIRISSMEGDKKAIKAESPEIADNKQQQTSVSPTVNGALKAYASHSLNGKEEAKATSEKVDNKDKPVVIDMEETVSVMQDFLDRVGNNDLRFRKDDNYGRVIMEIVDKETDEVVKQVPTKEFLDMVSRLNKLAGELMKDYPKYI